MSYPNQPKTRALYWCVGLVLCAGCLDRPVAPSEPVTTNVVVQQQANNAVKSIDFLLMIDNSPSMADKQTTLAVAVPQLLKQLVQPQCVDSDQKPFNPPISAQLGVEPPCAQGSPEFNPVNDIHIGVVTSSLGDHGANSLCTKGASAEVVGDDGKDILQPADVNDMSHLIGTLQRGEDALSADSNAHNTQFATINDQGFLAWGNNQQPAPAQTDLDAATSIFKDMVTATAENGCGLEAQLESWFRFLVDPVPPTLPLQPPVQGVTSRQGVDDALLLQRAQFLRPDSLVAIVMLTDENDCSLRDTDQGWVAASSGGIDTGSDQCKTNPNDPCCYSCTLMDHEGFGPPSGCAAACPNAQGTQQPKGIHDNPAQMNIRCWQQKRRFGYEFTYPTSRYTVALTKKELCPDQDFGDMDCDCTSANALGVHCNPGTRKFSNPLYSNKVGRMSDGTDAVGYAESIARADNSAVFLAGIVGVPWQDVSEPDSQADGVTLKYIPVTDARWTDSGGIWDKIYADDNDHGKTPGDPRMIESITPRAGLPDPTSGVGADPINGHEWNTQLRDLEYACVYKLPSAKPCDCLNAKSIDGCIYQHPNDCCNLSYSADAEDGAGADFDKPLCQDPATGSYAANTQYFAKAYPGLRELSVLRGYATDGETKGNSIVASICPKDLASDSTSPGYGYNPAVAAIIQRLTDRLRGSCLPRPLTVGANGEVPCNVIEAVTQDTLGGQDCASFCTAKQRNKDVTADNPSGGPTPKVVAAVQAQMKLSGICDQPGQALKCSDMCLCLLPQESLDNNKLNDPVYGNDLAVCQNADDGTANSLDPGYCYVDPNLKDPSGQPLAGNNPKLVDRCPDTQKRILRFVGNQPTANGGTAVPLTGATVFSACQGSSITSF